MRSAMKKITLLLAFFVGHQSALQSQEQICGTSTPSQIVSANPSYTLSSEITIPVFFHVIYRSSGEGNVPLSQLQEQINVLNNAFLGSKFSFYLAGVSRTLNNYWFYLDGIGELQMKQSLAIDPSHAINIYSALPTTFNGKASFPWEFSENDYRHGIIIDYRTLPDGSHPTWYAGENAVHEAGHYLGLYHTFQNGCTPQGDSVDDTPAEAQPEYSCTFNRDTCPTFPGLDPINNFMDYSTDYCRTQFTAGQRIRMESVAAQYRANLGGAILNIASNYTIPIERSFEFYSITLIFGSGASLIVNGKIVADSNDPNQRIVFTGTTASPGSWNGIQINSGNSSNVSTLRRCDIQYATDGIKITYTGNSNQVTIDKCRVRYNLNYGISVYGSSTATVHPTISNCIITDNGPAGVNLTNYAKPTVTGNRIENNALDGIHAASSSSAIITYNFISGHMENGLWCGYSSMAQVHRNTIKNNDLVGIWLTSNSNVTAYGAGTTNGRNEIRLNGEGIFSDQSSPIFGKDVTNQWGNNWTQDNAGYEAHDNGFGYILRAERCYWGGQQTNIYGNVDVTPYLTSLPNPVGWGQSDGYDPSYLVKPKPDDADVEVISMGVDNDLTSTSASSDGALFSNPPNDLNTAIAKGLATGNWGEASELITLLHLDLQNGLVPNVEFAAAEGYANNPQVASFIRKALALLLVEKDRLDKNLSAAFATLEAFGKSNAEHKAELLANAGLLHLYQQNDLPAAQKVLDELKTMAANGDSTAITHVKMFGLLLDDYQRLVGGGNTNFSERTMPRPLPLNQSSATASTQNYPNPFNPSTTIRFHLNQNKRVRLFIYDVTGQLTRVLADGEFIAGDHTITWNGRNQNGVAVASGVYFYELVVGQKVERKKMTLMR